MEAFTIQFCRAVQSYWRRRRYNVLETKKKAPAKVVRLGGGQATASAGPPRSFRLRRPSLRIRTTMMSPIRLLGRLRDTYVDSMLGLSGKGSGISAAVGAEGLLRGRVPKHRPVQLELGDLDRRLLLELRRSIRSSSQVAVL